MAILTFQSNTKMKDYKTVIAQSVVITMIAIFASSCGPKDPVEFRQVRNVAIHAATDPRLNGDVVFYNPNGSGMKLKKIKIEVFLDGRKTAEIDQDLKMAIPARKEFTIPIEAKLAIQEQGFLNTVFGMLNGTTKEVHYKGFLKINYRGIPVSVPVDYKSEVSIKL